MQTKSTHPKFKPVATLKSKIVYPAYYFEVKGDDALKIGDITKDAEQELNNMLQRFFYHLNVYIDVIKVDNQTTIRRSNEHVKDKRIRKGI